MCLAIFSVAAMLIDHASGQANLVRVVSPADMVLQPSNGDNGQVRLEFKFDPQVSEVSLNSGGEHYKLPTTQKAVTWSPCNSGAADNPNDVRMGYTAYNSAGTQIEGGDWHFKMGRDTTQPSVRITSPANRTVVRPGEALDIVVVGEESKTAETWQTGLRRLALTDPQNTQTSPETPSKICGQTQWRSENHFRYVVPRDVEPGLIWLTASAEDWAKNTGNATLDLLVLGAGFTGLWTTEGRLVKPDEEFRYSIYAVFSFTLDPRTRAVACGTSAKPYCGSARISFLPGREKHSDGWCDIVFTPAANVFKIIAHGLRQGNELKFLNIKPIEYVTNRYRKDCPSYTSYEDTMFAVGSILPEGITIAIPLRDHTTVTKHESLRSGEDLDHKVELYAPRQNR